MLRQRFERMIKGVNIGRSEVMRTPKDAVLDLVNYLPEDASIEDIQYHLYVLQKIRKGLKDDDEDRVISQTEMEKRFEKWLVP